MRAGSRQLVLWGLCGVVGALGLALPARVLPLEAAGCESWPSRAATVGLAASYVASVGLMAAAWLAWQRARPRFGAALVAGALVHAAALVAPPFLSLDPLFYAASGHAMARYDAWPYAPLGFVLPVDDPYLAHLSAEWRLGTSAYFPAWNLIARAIAIVARDVLATQLRLYQLLGLVVMTATAALTGFSVEKERRGSAAAAVLLCPLGVIEATQSAHNDHLLALAAALAAFAVARRRASSWGLGALAGGVAVKASGLLALGMMSLGLVAARLRAARRAVVVATGIAFVVVAAAGAIVVLPQLGRVTSLVGGAPTGPIQCLGSLECIPRFLLYRKHLFVAAWAVGVAFRVAGAAWLVYAGVRAGRPGRLLGWVGVGLFVYFTALHPSWQAWYLLPVLPLLPFLDERARRAITVGLIAAALVHAVRLSTNCAQDPIVRVLATFAEPLIAIVPAAIAWWRYRQAEAQPFAEVSVTDGKP